MSAMGFGDDFLLSMIHRNDPVLMRRADQAGVNYIGVDLERIGKRERQGHLNIWFTDHKDMDVQVLSQNVRRAKLFARTNPHHPELQQEIDRLLAYGARALMLPMFKTADDAARYVDMIAGRAEVILLLETVEAATGIDDIVRVEGIGEISIGLNDLSVALGASQVQVLISDLMVRLADAANGAGIRFGFGTVGRLGDQTLPINPDLIYAQYPRLNGVTARLSRYFLLPEPERIDISAEVAKFRARMNEWQARGPAAWEDARSALLDLVGKPS